MRSKLSLLCLLSLLWPFSGCQTIQDQPTAARLAVTYATAKVIENNPDYAPRIAEIAAQVRSTLAGEIAPTVALLEGIARAHIRWDKLSPADAVMVDLLLTELRTELERRLGAGLLEPEARLRVDTVVGWIEATARSMTQPPS